jgi:hypothetical protein
VSAHKIRPSPFALIRALPPPPFTLPSHLSAKYNESEEDVPDLQTLEDITQQPIPNETVLNYELFALKKMGWKITGTFLFV